MFKLDDVIGVILVYGIVGFWGIIVVVFFV